MSHPHHHEAYIPPQLDAPDEWHLHTADEGEAQTEHARIANPRVILVAFVLMVVTLVAVVGAIIVYFDSYVTRELARKSETLDTSGHLAYRSTAEMELSTAGPLDPQKQTVRIPIDRAIDRVVRAYEERRASAR